MSSSSLDAFLTARLGLPQPVAARLRTLSAESAGGPGVRDDAEAETDTPLPHQVPVGLLPPHAFPVACIFPDPLVDGGTSTAAAAEVARLLRDQGSAGVLSYAAGARVVPSVRGDVSAWVVEGPDTVPVAIATARALGCPAIAAVVGSWLPAAVGAMVSAGILGPRQAQEVAVNVQATCYPAGSAGYARHRDSGPSVPGRLASSAVYLGPRERQHSDGGCLELWPGTGGGLRRKKRARAGGEGGSAATVALGPSLVVIPKGGRALAWAADTHHRVQATRAGGEPRYALSAFFLRGEKNV